jgi:hypothetical protein
LPDKTLKEMDELVEHAAKEIQALGNLDVVIETPMAGGTGIEYRSNTIPRLAAQD